MALSVQLVSPVNDSRPTDTMDLVAQGTDSAYAGNWQRAQFWRTVLAPIAGSDVPQARNLTLPPLRVSGRSTESNSKSSCATRSKRKTTHGSLRCALCHSSFGQRGDLMRHIRVTHLGERKYHCEICGSNFGRRSILNRHRKRHQRETSSAKHSITAEQAAIEDAANSRSAEAVEQGPKVLAQMRL